jgi:putative transposase
VGWAFSADLRARVVLDALDMALTTRKPDSVIHHSDRGSQGAFGNRCKDESFFATLECELLDRHRFASHTQARMTVFQFIEGFYNPSRRHSALGYLSPIH